MRLAGLHLLALVVLVALVVLAPWSARARQYGRGGGKADNDKRLEEQRRRNAQQQQQQRHRQQEQAQREQQLREEEERDRAHRQQLLEEQRRQEQLLYPDGCEVHTAFLAPPSHGSLGVRVKRDADLPREKGVFVVVGVDPASPAFNVLAEGDTIMTINDLPTETMKMSAFSEAIQSARVKGEGLVRVRFWTQKCVGRLRGVFERPPDYVQKEKEGEEEAMAAAEVGKEKEKGKQAPSPQITTKTAVGKQKQTDDGKQDDDDDHALAEELPKQRNNNTLASPIPHSGDEEDEDDEDDEDDDDGMQQPLASADEPSNRVVATYEVSIANFTPPLGLRVVEEHRMLQVVAITGMPERWTKTAIGDGLLSLGESQRVLRTTDALKRSLLAIPNGASVPVRFSREIERHHRAAALESLPDLEHGPLLTFRVVLPRAQLAFLDVVQLPEHHTYGDVAVGAIRGGPVDFLLVGDRVQRVGENHSSPSSSSSSPGGTNAKATLADVEREQKTENRSGMSPVVQLTVVRGVPGTFAQLATLGMGPLAKAKEKEAPPPPPLVAAPDVDADAGAAVTATTAPPTRKDAEECAVPAGKKESTLASAKEEEEEEEEEEEYENTAQAANDTTKAAETDDDDELERMRTEAAERAREAEKLQERARKAQADFERIKEEKELARKRKLAEKTRLEAEAAAERESKKARKLECAEHFGSVLEDAIVRALSDPSVLRALAKQVVEVVKEDMGGGRGHN